MSQDALQNNKRIIKNSLLLYLRMFFTMAIGMFTSRIILQTLGEVDFGLYNVVGGIVGMFMFIQSSMSNASSRFITYATGKGDETELRKTFQSIFTVHILLAIIVFFLLETVGYYLFTKLSIPSERYHICLWIYQYTVVATCLNITTMPFEASIIAHEKMDFYAYLSISDVILKLLIIYVLIFIDFDKLFIYGTLFFLTNIINISIKVSYCYIQFKYITIKFLFTKQRFMNVFQFAGWSLFGNMSLILTQQGLNFLFNIFFGPIINAARGLAVQVQNIVARFTSSIHTAINPQITKSYARHDTQYMKMLIIASSRYSFFLLFVMSFPLFLETKKLLQIWLGNYPEYTVDFIRILIFQCIMDNLIYPLSFAINATANIKSTQITVSILYLCSFLTCWVILKIGLNPCWTLIINVIFNALVILLRVKLLKSHVDLSLKEYCIKIYGNIALITISTFIVYYLLRIILDEPPTFLTNIIIGLILSSSVVWILGLSQKEKTIVKHVLNSKILKRGND